MTLKVSTSASWGDDILAIGTFLKNKSEGLYNLYVVDPSTQQILAYAPARDGSNTGRVVTFTFADGRLITLYHEDPNNPNDR
jgi:hypothetical protein